MGNQKTLFMHKIQKSVIFVLAIFAVLSSTGCHKRDTAQIHKRETPSKKENPLSTTSQLNRMTEYVKKQIKEGDTYFAVIDLDQNGRLELACSTGHQGSGQFSHSTFYQMDTSGSQMEECKTYWKDGKSQPDLVNGIDKVYHDTKTGEYHYITQGYSSDESAADDFADIQALTLKENSIAGETLGYRKGIWRKKKKKRINRYYQITKKGKESEILPDDFNEDALADLKFGQCEKTSVNIDWFQIGANEKKLSSENIYAYLEKSCRNFALGYFLKQTELQMNLKHLESEDKMKVPQLVDMPDSRKQDRLNQLIRETVQNRFSWVDEDIEDYSEDIEDYSYLLWDFQCTVKYAGSDRLSILIQYEGYGKGAAHPNSIAEVLNLNLDKEEMIPKKEILPDRHRKKVGQLILNGTCRDITNGDFYRKTQKKYNNINPLKDKEDWKYIDLYFTNDSVGVVVFTFHAIGDYAVYEVPRANYEEEISQ